MDKKYLRNLPREQALPAFFDMARENKSMAWLFTASKKGDILQVTVYKASSLRNDNPDPKYRCFFEEYDYITQDLEAEKTRWLTGKMSSIFAGHWYAWTRNAIRERLVIASDDDEQIMREHFDRESEHPERNAWDLLDRWQDTVLERKLDARREKELQHTREMMELVPELPDDFDSWLDGYVMRDKRYLIYDGDKKKSSRMAYCTHCRHFMEITPKKMNLRMNERGICPECECDVTMKPFKRLPFRTTDSKDAAIIQRLGEDRVLVRYFEIVYTFERDDLLHVVKKSRCVWEKCREFLTGGGKNRKKESFEFAVYKQRGLEQWCPDVDAVRCGEAVLYTNGLRETLAGTDWQYSGLEAFQSAEGCNEIPVWRYIDCYPEQKDLEVLVKAGLTSLAAELVRDPWDWRNGARVKRKIPEDLARLSKEHRRILRDMNGGSSMISQLRELELCQNTSNADDVKDFICTFGTERRLISELGMMGISLRRFTRYAQKQVKTRWNMTEHRRKARVNDFLHDWRDYIGWCRDLGYNLDDEYNKMPPDFSKAHDRLMEEAKRKQDEIQRKKQEQMEREIREALKEVQAYDLMQMKTKNLMIVVPASADDLKKEGQALHHCVATYAERVAKGKTLILFVRRTENPEEPYFTLEWRDGKVQQCRGSHNCGMPADVSAFVKSFEQRMQEALEGRKQCQRVKVS